MDLAEEDGDAGAVWGEGVGVGVRDPFDEAVESEATQIVGHLRPMRSIPDGEVNLHGTYRRFRSAGVVTMTWVRHDPRQLLVVVAVMVGAVAGCGDSDDAPVPTPDASAYAAALAPFMPVADPEEPPNVFVAPFEETLALEEQVAIIELLGDGYDITFVDDPATAVDTDAAGRPVREEGLLIVLGTIPAEPPYVVRVEEYRRQDDVSAQLVTLVWRTDHWQVASEETVRPEAVILDE